MAEMRDKRGLTEAEAIAQYRAMNYPKPALTADIAVFARCGAGMKLAAHPSRRASVSGVLGAAGGLCRPGRDDRAHCRPRARGGDRDHGAGAVPGGHLQRPGPRPAGLDGVRRVCDRIGRGDAPRDGGR